MMETGDVFVANKEVNLKMVPDGALLAGQDAWQHIDMTEDEEVHEEILKRRYTKYPAGTIFFLLGVSPDGKTGVLQHVSGKLHLYTEALAGSFNV